MRNPLSFGVLNGRTPWSGERPVGEARERLPRFALGLSVEAILLVVSFRAFGSASQCQSATCALLRLIVALATALLGTMAFCELAGDSWRGRMRRRVDEFGKSCLRGSGSTYDPWEGVRYECASDDLLPGLSMDGGSVVTVYAATLTECPDPMSDLVSLSMVDDCGEELQMHALPDARGEMDLKALREMCGTGVSVYPSRWDPLGQGDRDYVSVLFAATEFVSFQPATALTALYWDGCMFDVRAINVLDECAALGIEEATDRRLTHWERLIGCSQALGVEGAPSKSVTFSTPLAARLCRDVHVSALAARASGLNPASKRRTTSR